MPKRVEGVSWMKPGPCTIPMAQKRLLVVLFSPTWMIAWNTLMNGYGLMGADEYQFGGCHAWHELNEQSEIARPCPYYRHYI